MVAATLVRSSDTRASRLQRQHVLELELVDQLSHAVVVPDATARVGPVPASLGVLVDRVAPQTPRLGVFAFGMVVGDQTRRLRRAEAL
jgi:hypothetical protein